MNAKLLLVLTLSSLPAATAFAAANFDANSLARIATCQNSDTTYRVYGPLDAALGVAGSIRAYRGENGQISMDLTINGKGDSLEPVRLGFDGDNLAVRNINRDLPTARIPMTGGTVTFDERFGKDMTCIIGAPGLDD